MPTWPPCSPPGTASILAAAGWSLSCCACAGWVTIVLSPDSHGNHVRWGPPPFTLQGTEAWGSRVTCPGWPDWAGGRSVPTSSDRSWGAAAWPQPLCSGFAVASPSPHGPCLLGCPWHRHPYPAEWAPGDPLRGLGGWSCSTALARALWGAPRFLGSAFGLRKRHLCFVSFCTWGLC